MKRAIACALILLLFPIPSLAEEPASTLSETFADSRDANGTPCFAEPISATHTLPKREGVVSGKIATIALNARVDPNGMATYLRILRSSNIEALDTLTVNWIKNTWRWKPFDGSCKSTNVSVTVNWRRSDVGPGESKANCTIQPIMRTHTLAPRSPNTRNLSGPVLMELAVGLNGNPSDLTVLQSSGNQELDALAMAWIEKAWRWEPRSEGCDAYRTRINMRW